MSEDQGYSGKALECLKKNNAKVGDSIKITADLTYSGILILLTLVICLVFLLKI